MNQPRNKQGADNLTEDGAKAVKAMTTFLQLDVIRGFTRKAFEDHNNLPRNDLKLELWHLLSVKDLGKSNRVSVESDPNDTTITFLDHQIIAKSLNDALQQAGIRHSSSINEMSPYDVVAHTIKISNSDLNNLTTDQINLIKQTTNSCIANEYFNWGERIINEPQKSFFRNFDLMGAHCFFIAREFGHLETGEKYKYFLQEGDRKFEMTNQPSPSYSENLYRAMVCYLAAKLLNPTCLTNAADKLIDRGNKHALEADQIEGATQKQDKIEHLSLAMKLTNKSIRYYERAQMLGHPDAEKYIQFAKRNIESYSLELNQLKEVKRSGPRM